MEHLITDKFTYNIRDMTPSTEQEFIPYDSGGKTLYAPGNSKTIWYIDLDVPGEEISGDLVRNQVVTRESSDGERTQKLLIRRSSENSKGNISLVCDENGPLCKKT